MLDVGIEDLAELRRAHRPLRFDTDPPIARAFVLSRPPATTDAPA